MAQPLWPARSGSAGCGLKRAGESKNRRMLNLRLSAVLTVLTILTVLTVLTVLKLQILRILMLGCMF